MEFQREETTQKVIGIIADKLSMPVENITLDSTFKDLGGD